MIQTEERTASRILSRGLNAWLCREALVELVQTAVKSVNWEQPGHEGRLGRVKTTRSEIVLQILTYCYAIGIYQSREIEERIYREKAGQVLFSSLPVDAAVFRQFRHYNRDLVQECLMKVLREVFRIRWTAVQPQRSGHSFDPAQAGDDCGESTFRQELLAETQRRIDLAVELDALDRDNQ